MGRCVKLSGPPLAINIQLPGGPKMGSMASGTQQMPNLMDPFQSLIEGVQPALAPIKPVMDIIGFIMSLMDIIIKVLTVLGAVATIVAGPNVLSTMFPIPPVKDENGDDVGPPPIPDVSGFLASVGDSVVALLCQAMKMAGLIPQLSTVATIKDSLITALGFMDAAMSQVNSLTDTLSSLPSPDTGNSIFDALRICAMENSEKELEAKLGPVGNLVPLMSVVSLLAQAASQPLPRVVYDMSKVLIGVGLLQFFDVPGGPTADEQKDNFLNIIDDMTITGLPFEIPDFSDLSSVGETMDEIKEKMEPLVPAIELVQEILNKFTNC
jgi:hypothetical protein